MLELWAEPAVVLAAAAVLRLLFKSAIGLDDDRARTPFHGARVARIRDPLLDDAGVVVKRLVLRKQIAHGPRCCTTTSVSRLKRGCAL